MAGRTHVNILKQKTNRTEGNYRIHNVTQNRGHISELLRLEGIFRNYWEQMAYFGIIKTRGIFWNFYLCFLSMYTLWVFNEPFTSNWDRLQRVFYRLKMYKGNVLCWYLNSTILLLWHRLSSGGKSQCSSPGSARKHPVKPAQPRRSQSNLQCYIPLQEQFDNFCHKSILYRETSKIRTCAQM